MMMPKDPKIKNNILSHWTINLVGTGNIFLFNLLINLSGGLLYSFKIIPSPFLLLIFGIVSPVLFTLCLYSYVRNSSGMLLNESLPMAFVSRSGNRLLMTFDICLIIGFALLIFFGPLDYFLFRFLQTLFFPCMLLIFLRVLHLSNISENHSNDYE